MIKKFQFSNTIIYYESFYTEYLYIIINILFKCNNSHNSVEFGSLWIYFLKQTINIFNFIGPRILQYKNSIYFHIMDVTILLT